jgi:hypothetical protein
MTTATEETVVRYAPYGAAADLFRTRNSETVIAGPAGTGKSLAALFRVHLAALNNPDIRCLIARKTAVSLGSTTLVTFEKKVAKHALASRIVHWFGGSAREPAGYRYSNGSVVVVGGMDKPEKIMSAEYDLVFADEATELTETDWEYIGTRLRNGALSWQQQIAACNPGHPTHWINQRCNKGTATMLKSRHQDNPEYYNRDGTLTPEGDAYINGKLGKLTGVRKLRLKDGIWAAAEGLVYEAWDDAVHLVDPFEVPTGWTRWWSIDLGYVNPTVVQFWAEDGDGRLWLYREIYRTKTLVEDHAKEILRMVTRCVTCCKTKRGSHDCWACDTCVREWTEPKPRAVITDHDAEDRATLERHLSLSTTAAHKSVSDGIQATQSRLKAAGDGKPRLFIMRGALVERDAELDEAKKPCCTEDEITGYVWDRGTAAQQAGDKTAKDAPLKLNDHGMDAMRYMVAERDLGGRPNIRWL